MSDGAQRAMQALEIENAELKEQLEAQERELTAARIDVRKAAEIMELLVSKDAPEQADWDDINSWLAASSPAKRPE